MATTLVACAVRFDRAWGACGDSPVTSSGSASHATHARSYRGRRSGAPGLLSPGAAKAETRHTLSRSLGNDLFVNVEVSERQVFAEDVLLLCSDGCMSVSATDMPRPSRTTPA